MPTIRTRLVRQCAVLSFSIAALAGCGGGGGGGVSGAAVAPVSAPTPTPTPAPAPAPAPNFPVLVTSAAFSLPAIADPVERMAPAGHQLGRVLLPSGAAGPAGLTVEWLDASAPAAPRVLASARTDASGAFDIAGASSVAPADQWLRVTLPDGTVLRGFASGWTELSLGTEVALGEIARLRTAGALAARPLPMAELAIGQQSLSLLGQAQFAGQDTAAAIKSMTAFVTRFQPWNQFLERLSSATPDAGPGDVAAFLPFERVDATVPATLNADGVTSTPQVGVGCFVGTTPKWRECYVSVPSNADLSEQLSVRPGGIFLHNMGGTDGLDKLLYQIGDLPLLEFAPAVGTRVIYNNPQLVQDGDAAIHAAIKVTRRTYPVAPVTALGGTVAAIEVVLDYEVAILNTTTRQQADLLVRERRWFSPLGGRVRIASEGLARAGSTIVPGATTLTLNGAGFTVPTAFPLAGTVDAVTLPLAHRHAVASAARNRVYVATETNGGQILELDASTLATVRTVGTAGVPVRLAVSSDGARVYAALAGAVVVELRGADLSEVRRFTTAIASDPYSNAPFDRIADLAVDPFDAARVLAVLKSTRSTASGPAQLFSNGVLQASVSDSYYPDQVGWSSVRDEFFTGSFGSPQSLFRFRAGATSASELKSLLRVNEVGVTEAGGDILTASGTIIDAPSLTPRRSLALPGYSLVNCVRLDARSDVCEVAGFSTTVDNPIMRFDHASGAILGTFRPATSAALAACPVNPATQIWTASGKARLLPMADGRLLVSNGDGDQRCGLQLWTLHGYQN